MEITRDNLRKTKERILLEKISEKKIEEKVKEKVNIVSKKLVKKQVEGVIYE